MSGHPRQHIEVAVAVDARWRHQGGEAVDQLQRRQDQRATGAEGGFRVVVTEKRSIPIYKVARLR